MQDKYGKENRRSESIVANIEDDLGIYPMVPVLSFVFSTAICLGATLWALIAAEWVGAHYGPMTRSSVWPWALAACVVILRLLYVFICNRFARPNVSPLGDLGQFLVHGAAIAAAVNGAEQARPLLAFIAYYLVSIAIVNTLTRTSMVDINRVTVDKWLR